MNREIIVKTDEICKYYRGIHAVDKVNLTIHKGDIYGFVGKNGAGKTTLIRLLTGVAKPTSGKYSLFGVDNPKELLKARRRIAAMVETPALYSDLTAKENLMTRCILLGINDPKVIRSRLEEVGLGEIIDSKRKVKDFSLGMRQRLGIAMSILGNPELLILDEPTNGLDPEGIREMRELLIKINREMGITMLVSSHILSELSKFATTYGFIDRGQLIKEISAEELFEKTKKSLLIETDDVEKAVSLIKSKNPLSSTEVSGHEIKVFGVDNVADILALLFQAGIKVSKVHEEENGLEDYFLNLIGGLEND